MRVQGQDFPEGLALSQVRSGRSHPCPGGESSPEARAWTG
jgi:hypothetical protein